MRVPWLLPRNCRHFPLQKGLSLSAYKVTTFQNATDRLWQTVADFLKKKFSLWGQALEGGRKIDAVILADVSDSLWRQLLRLGRDPHGIEDLPLGRQIAIEGTRTDIGQAGQFRFTDKAIAIIVIIHKMVV